jgi:hypothetical protein
MVTRRTLWLQVIKHLDHAGAGLALDFELGQLSCAFFMFSCIC